MHSNGNHKQNEKTTHRMIENICKQCDRQGVNLQNIQIAHTTQHQKQQPDLKMHRSPWIDIFPKKTYRWPTDTWKDAQYHLSSGKCKLKPQWDTASFLSEWLSSKRQQITSVSEDREKREPSSTVCLENSMEGLKKLKIVLPYDQAISLLSI